MKAGAWDPSAELRDLESEFQEKEIKRTVWELGLTKHWAQAACRYCSLELFG